MLQVSRRGSRGMKSCFSFYLAFLVLLGKGESAKGHTSYTFLDRNESGVITSPGYPRNYPDNSNYTWILNTGHRNASVMFSILDFNLPEQYYNSACDDYLKIEEIVPFYRQVIKRCGGKFNPFNQSATGSKITISFVSDDKYNEKGFKLTFKVHLPEMIPISTTTTPSPRPMTTTTTTTSKTTTTTTTTAITETKGKEISTLVTDTALTIQSSTENQSERNSSTTRPAAITETKGKEISTLVTDTALTIQSSTENQSERNSSTTRPAVPLILGISAIEIALIAIGVYIVRKRRSSSREEKKQDVNFDKKLQPVSRESAQSIHSIGNFYESIPLEHFSTDVILEDDGNENQDETKMYADIPDHVYDRTFKHRPYLNQQPNMYNMISELKLKRL